MQTLSSGFLALGYLAENEAPLCWTGIPVQEAGPCPIGAIPPCHFVFGEQPGAHRACWSCLLTPSGARDLQIHHTERVQAGRARPSHQEGVCQAVTRKPVLLTSGHTRCRRPQGFKRHLLLQVEERVSSSSFFSFPPFI